MATSEGCLHHFATPVWLLAVPFVFVCAALGFAMEVLFGIRPSRTESSDGTGLFG